MNVHILARLTPVYAIMVALAASWFNHLGSGPMWNHIVSSETEDCRQNWWYNLLYLNNYINSHKSVSPKEIMFSHIFTDLLNGTANFYNHFHMSADLCFTLHNLL
jgi:hypothetical protein